MLWQPLCFRIQSPRRLQKYAWCNRAPQKQTPLHRAARKQPKSEETFLSLPPPGSWSERKFLPADAARVSCTLPLNLDISDFHTGCGDEIIRARNTHIRAQKKSEGSLKVSRHPEGQGFGLLAAAWCCAPLEWVNPEAPRSSDRLCLKTLARRWGLALSAVAAPCVPAAFLTLGICSESTWDAQALRSLQGSWEQRRGGAGQPLRGPTRQRQQASRRAAGATSLLVLQPSQSPFCGSSSPPTPNPHPSVRVNSSTSFKRPTQQLVLFSRPRPALLS